MISEHTTFICRLPQKKLKIKKNRDKNTIDFYIYHSVAAKANLDWTVWHEITEMAFVTFPFSCLTIPANFFAGAAATLQRRFVFHLERFLFPIKLKFHRVKTAICFYIHRYVKHIEI
jgi:hypothetical protein